jgi:hypothetical protein
VISKQASKTGLFQPLLKTGAKGVAALKNLSRGESLTLSRPKSSAGSPRGVRTAGELLSTKSPFSPGKVPSFDFLEVEQTSRETKFSGVNGSKVAPEGHPTRKVATKALQQAPLGRGERLRVQKLPGVLTGYQTQVLDAEGKVLREGRYQNVMGKTVRVSKKVHARKKPSKRPVKPIKKTRKAPPKPHASPSGTRIKPKLKLKTGIRLRGLRL